MEQVEHASQGYIPALGSIVEFVPRGLVVAVINKLTGVVIYAIRPVAIFARGEEYHESLVLTPSR